MKLFLAGGEDPRFARILDSVNSKRRLLSYYYLEKKLKGALITDVYGKDLDIMLDSGAYTAYHQGVEIDVYAYIRFIKNQGVKTYINLDDIKSLENSQRNLKTMEQAGLDPIPVWHMAEPFSILEDYCKSYKYVGVSVSQSQSDKLRANVASSIFEHFPKTDFHMFAVTQPKVLMQYPFYSADSTTWLNSGKYGALITIDGYLMIGRENKKSPRHFHNFSRERQIQWQTYLKLQGFDINKLLEDYYERLRASAKYFVSLEAAINSFEAPKKGKRMLDSFFTIQQIKRTVLRCLSRKF